MTERPSRSTRTARGVVLVHSSPRALCPHVEWAVGTVLGEPVSCEWREQPAQRGSMRGEYYWEGPVGSGSKIASALHGWEQLRYEVSEEATATTDGSRWMHTPALGIFHVQTDTAGNTVVSEDRVRHAIEQAGFDALALHQQLRMALGQAWDDELEPFRWAGDLAAPVVWLHRAG